MTPWLDDREADEVDPNQLSLEGVDDSVAEMIHGFGQMTVLDEIEATNETDRAAEIAHEWVGLPVFREDPDPPKLVLSFESEEARTRLLAALEVKTRMSRAGRGGKTVCAWWPDRGQEDLISLRFATERELAGGGE